VTNVVYKKIKELSAEEMKPRPAISIDTLMYELNVNLASLKQLLAPLIAERLIVYNEREMRSVKLTLLGASVTR
jgi:hypothetical protein